MAANNEQEAAAGLYRLLNHASEGRGTEACDPHGDLHGDLHGDPLGCSPNTNDNADAHIRTHTNSSLSACGEEEQTPEEQAATAESMRKLTEMLLQNRPVVDPLKNQGYGIVTPHQHDILSGRGNGANQHPGNIFFRNLIHKYKHHYIHTGPSEKKLITKRIVEEVQQRNPPGRFLKQNHDNELWDCLDIDKVLKKTGQALREKAPELKKRAKEEYKTRNTAIGAIVNNPESYFRNSRQHVHGLTNKKNSSSSGNNVSNIAGLGMNINMNMNSDYMNTSMTNMMDFNMSSMGGTPDHTHSNYGLPYTSAGALDVLANQTIPLANASQGQGGSINDCFNMSHLAEATKKVVEVVEHANRTKTQELVEKVSAFGATETLSSIYEWLRAYPDAVITTKKKVKQTSTKSKLPNAHAHSLAVVGRSQHASSQSQSQRLINPDDIVPNSATPHSHDVLFRNGSVLENHPGSAFFCEQANILLPKYKGPVVNEKRIEQKIIAEIGARWPPGRFLCAADTTGTTWQVLSFDQTLQATSSHLRRACFDSQRIVMPNPRDVLVIRGNSQHQGNIYFRNLIEKLTPKVEPINHFVRKRVAKKIMDEIERVGGRFLKFNALKNFWEPLDAETIMTKTLQGMRDYQKKREIKVKPIKPTGVVVPALNFVTETVVWNEDNNGDTRGPKNCDPPGVFYNYYTQTGTDNETLAISTNGKDPPGQVPNVIPPALQHQAMKGILASVAIKSDPCSPGQSEIQNHRIVSDGPPEMLNGNFNGNNENGGIINPSITPPVAYHDTTSNMVTEESNEVKRKRSYEYNELSPISSEPVDSKRMKLEP